MNKKIYIELNEDTNKKLYDEYLKVLKSPMYVTLESKPTYEEYIASILVAYAEKMNEFSNLMSKDSIEAMTKQMESMFGNSGSLGDLSDMFSSMFGNIKKAKNDNDRNKEETKNKNKEDEELKS